MSSPFYPGSFWRLFKTEPKQTPIYLFIKRFEGKLKRFFKLRPEGNNKKKFDK